MSTLCVVLLVKLSSFFVRIAHLTLIKCGLCHVSSLYTFARIAQSWLGIAH